MPSLRSDMGAKGHAIVASNRGALSRVMELLEALLQQSSHTT
jgi:3-deoxy-D-manno-octulosonic-acid transferase